MAKVFQVTLENGKQLQFDVVEQTPEEVKKSIAAKAADLLTLPLTTGTYQIVAMTADASKVISSQVGKLRVDDAGVKYLSQMRPDTGEYDSEVKVNKNGANSLWFLWNAGDGVVVFRPLKVADLGKAPDPAKTYEAKFQNGKSQVFTFTSDPEVVVEEKGISELGKVLDAGLYLVQALSKEGKLVQTTVWSVQSMSKERQKSAGFQTYDKEISFLSPADGTFIDKVDLDAANTAKIWKDLLPNGGTLKLQAVTTTAPVVYGKNTTKAAESGSTPLLIGGALLAAFLFTRKS